VSDLPELARAAGRLALDTEFMSERRYQAMLCLAQFAVREGDGIAADIFDPVQYPDLDPAPLAAVLADPEVEVIVHAGRQDVAILKRTWSTEVRRLFDTQIAAAFLGYGVQESYKSLVRRVLKLEIADGESFTRWDRRPLTDDQLRYAREDAVHLLEIGEKLEVELEEAGRLEWAREESRALEDISDERDPDRLFTRLPRVSKLRGDSLGIARELVEWREDVAREADRNAPSILPDQVLVEVARRPPKRRRDLEDVRGLPDPTRHRRGDALIEAVQRGAGREAPPLPKAAPPPDSRAAPLVALAQAIVRARSQDTGVAAQLIATGDELTRLVSDLRRGDGEPSTRVLSGWRRELVGEELLELLAGRRALRVGEDGRLEVDSV
jgi:ribonuclease D